jgi:hypothetical protein
VVRLWETASGKELRNWRLPVGVLAVAFSPDGRHVITSNSNTTLYILRLQPADLDR